MATQGLARARTGSRLRDVLDSEQCDPMSLRSTSTASDRVQRVTQLTLGVDRDSAIVAFDYDERDQG